MSNSLSSAVDDDEIHIQNILNSVKRDTQAALLEVEHEDMHNAGDEGTKPRYRNGDKVRAMVRLRRLIDELNDACDEHFVLAIALPETSRHISYYGSRAMVRTLYKSNFASMLHEDPPLDEKICLYLPVADVSPMKGEDSLPESVLYAQVLRLLDMYNYPAREHFSFKMKGKKGACPRPKPVYWPREIKFGSLLCGHICKLVEPYCKSMVASSRREIIQHVLTAIRQHYSWYVSQLGEEFDTKTDEMEEVDIEDVANYEELTTDSLGSLDVEGDKPPHYAAPSDIKEGEPQVKKLRLISHVPAGGSSQLAQQMQRVTTKRRRARYPAGSIGQVLSPSKWVPAVNTHHLQHQQQRKQIKFAPLGCSENDRLLTLNAQIGIHGMWPPSASYEIKSPAVVGVSNEHPLSHHQQQQQHQQRGHDVDHLEDHVDEDDVMEDGGGDVGSARSDVRRLNRSRHLGDCLDDSVIDEDKEDILLMSRGHDLPGTSSSSPREGEDEGDAEEQFPTDIANEEEVTGGGECSSTAAGTVMIIDGQEYTVVDGDEVELDPNLVYDEISIGEDGRYIRASTSADSSQSLMIQSSSDDPTSMNGLSHHDSLTIPLQDEFVLSPDTDPPVSVLRFHHPQPAAAVEQSPDVMQRPRTCRLVRNVLVERPEGPVIQKFVVKTRKNI